VRSELDCAGARVDLSARLDGELSPEESDALDRHLSTCHSCRAHEHSLRRVRRVLRTQPAEAVPDLAAQIMQRVEPGSRSRWRPAGRIAAVAAVVTAALLAGSSLLTSTRPPDSAAAGAIARRVRAAARALDNYRATFEIVERGWHHNVPVRRFSAEVAFRSPEDFRLTLRDQTTYPGARAWPVNNIDLVASPRRIWLREPYTCPVRSLPACSAPGARETTVVGRQPFDGVATLPTDIIVPLETLASSGGFEVVGRAEVLGRRAHHITLPQRQAIPLIQALQQGGSWRAFRPFDRVDLWIDARTWFPLRFEVRRRLGGRVLLAVRATSFTAPRHIPPAIFRVPRGGIVRRGGWSATARPHKAPWVPRYTAGLTPYRFGVTAQDQRVASYAQGMTWLKVTHEDSSRSFVGQLRHAQRVPLSEDRVGYYEPATDTTRRRVDLYGARSHVFLESNLERAVLLDVARSVVTGGDPLPDRVRALGGLIIERISPQELSGFSFAKLPTRLPRGYVIASSVLSQGRGHRTLSIHLRGREAEYGGSGIEITQSPTVAFLPPSFEILDEVKINGLRGRWSPARGEVEWMDGGTYRAVRAPSLGRRATLAIARGLR
jgi:hypothetical protein